MRLFKMNKIALDDQELLNDAMKWAYAATT